MTTSSINQKNVRLLDGNGWPIIATVGEELKVAQTYTLADLTNKYGLDLRIWDYKTAITGSVTHLAAQSALQVNVLGTNGSSADLLTNTYYKYQAGYTQRVTLSIINSDTGQSNQVRQWGYFDDNNGLFYQLSGTSLSIIERSNTSGSPVDTPIAQSSWNVDPLNGSGPSGITLDVSKGNLYDIEIQWYGVGVVQYYINNILVHRQNHTNLFSAPYMRTAQLPMRIRVANTGASSAGGLTFICGRVVAQGQIHDPYQWSYGVGNVADVLVPTSQTPILSIRPKALFKSIDNRCLILPQLASVSTEDYKIRYKIIMDGSLTGASWTSVDANSATEYDVSATALSGGEVLFSDYLPNDMGSSAINLEPLFDVLGRVIRNAGFLGTGQNVADVLTIVAENQAVGRTRVRANLSWTEIE